MRVRTSDLPHQFRSDEDAHQVAAGWSGVASRIGTVPLPGRIAVGAGSVAAVQIADVVHVADVHVAAAVGQGAQQLLLEELLWRVALTLAGVVVALERQGEAGAAEGLQLLQLAGQQSAAFLVETEGQLVVLLLVAFLVLRRLLAAILAIRWWLLLLLRLSH